MTSGSIISDFSFSQMFIGDHKVGTETDLIQEFSDALIGVICEKLHCNLSPICQLSIVYYAKLSGVKSLFNYASSISSILDKGTTVMQPAISCKHANSGSWPVDLNLTLLAF